MATKVKGPAKKEKKVGKIKQQMKTISMSGGVRHELEFAIYIVVPQGPISFR